MPTINGKRVCPTCLEKECHPNNARCLDCYREYAREYRKKNKKKLNAYKRKWRMNDYYSNPTTRWKEKANGYVRDKIKSGILQRQYCQICSKKGAQAHHDSYLKKDWLNVRWLCQLHHSEWHRNNEIILPKNILELEKMNRDSKERMIQYKKDIAIEKKQRKLEIRERMLARQAEMQVYRNEGKTYKQIGEIYNISRQRVQQIIAYK
tara:strand:+ start:3476 stop:4096 length:621 start_codon:yes stop_codon:yes gene_type:complete